MRTWSIFLLTLALATAGCTDDGGGPEADADDTTPEPDTDDDATATEEPEDEAPPAPIYENGTVTGTLDCQLATNGQAPQSAKTWSVPAEAANRSYEVSIVRDSADATQTQAVLCFSYDGGTTWSLSGSGTLTDDITEIRIAADAAPNGVGYSIYVA